MSSPLLYSTNPAIKLYIQEMWRNDVHHVWCSEYFDRDKVSPYSIGSLVGASSNPADIYRELKSARGDRGSQRIKAHKAMLTGLATTWAAGGEISDDDRDDIIALVDTADSQYWRPLLYVIPRAPVDSRLILQRMTVRSGAGKEYVLGDLQRSEFHVIEI